MFGAISNRDCMTLALVWGAGAALFVAVLLRGSAPGPLVFVLAVAAFVAIVWRARKGCAAVGAEPAATAIAPAHPVAAPVASHAPAAPQKPVLLSAPREGGSDDLKRIKGVGPKLEALLHSMGVHHFDQIAKWTAAEMAWVDDNLEGFKGRASRDDWIAQAKVLASGGVTEFAARVDAGDVPTSQA